MSQNGTRLGVVGFSEEKIFIFTSRITRRPEGVDIQISNFLAICSDHFDDPHGLTFLGNDHLVVCNREGDVCLFRIPDVDASVKEVRLEPLASLNGKGYLRAKVKSPGSLDSYSIGDDQYRIVVCNDQWNFVSAHRISLGNNSPRVTTEGILIEKGLVIPDGAAVSPDYRWIAITNHVHGEVLMYENNSRLNRKTEPVAHLNGLICPHGLDFDPQGNLWVVDASTPYLTTYRKPDQGWSGTVSPAQSIRMMDNETFYRGRYDAREGGIKGIYIDPISEVAITTHKLGMLEFHDLLTLRATSDPVDTGQFEDLRRVRDADVAHKKTKVIRRQWTWSRRFREVLPPVGEKLGDVASRIGPKLTKIRLHRINQSSKDSILDPAGPVVSMTTYAPRIPFVHLAIESIARGSLKPRKLVLWISDPEILNGLPPTLERLVSRGLEIKPCDELGPHCKYFPYVEHERQFTEPLVTADDDVFYPLWWLESLVKAYQDNPSVIHCFRARRMMLNRFHFEPYRLWEFSSGTEPSHLNFITSVGGVIYPPAFLASLKTRGRAFETCCPKADDIWLSYVAFQEGFKVAQVDDSIDEFDPIRGTQGVRLLYENVLHGGNQLQLDGTFSPEDRSKLFALQKNGL